MLIQCGHLHFVLLYVFTQGLGASMSQVVGLPNNSYKPITNTAWVRARLCILQKGCTRFATASDKVYQLLVRGRWFSPGTPASSTTKTGRCDIAEILLKVALNTKHQNQSICLHALVLSCDVLYNFLIKNYVWFVFFPQLFVASFLLFVFIFEQWCPPLLDCMSNMAGLIKSGIAYPS